MPLRRALGLAIPLACAALFVRLGVWQLSRLAERRAFNATLAVRLSAPPVDVAALPADTAQGHYRRVTAAGVLRYDREVVLAGRARQGAPGVHLLTPLDVPGRGARDAVVMVNRGWVYSADAATVEPARWRERDTVRVEGYVETYRVDSRKQTAVSSQPSARSRERSASGAPLRTIRGLDREAIERAVGSSVAPYVLVQTGDTAVRDSVPVRLGLPSLDEGPHRNYAIQWFAFAVIAVVGGVALFKRQTADSRRLTADG